MAKKIAAIASLSIIGILIIATIIMANIKLSFNINCATPDHIYVNRYTSVNESEKADKIVDLINNASKENSLSALFNGNFDKKAKIVSVSGTKTVPSSGFYVEFAYNNKQTLMDGDEEYKDSKGNTYTYERLVFTVPSSQEVSIVKVYVIADSNAPDSYSYYYELEADFYDLYNYLIENGFSGN